MEETDRKTSDQPGVTAGPEEEFLMVTFCVKDGSQNKRL